MGQVGVVTKEARAELQRSVVLGGPNAYAAVGGVNDVDTRGWATVGHEGWRGTEGAGRLEVVYEEVMTGGE